MKLKNSITVAVAAGLLAVAMGLGVIPAAHASGTTYTQTVASAGTCTTMETATVKAFKASGYKVRRHSCLKSPEGYTLMIGYSK